MKAGLNGAFKSMGGHKDGSKWCTWNGKICRSKVGK